MQDIRVGTTEGRKNGKYEVCKILLDNPTPTNREGPTWLVAKPSAISGSNANLTSDIASSRKAVMFLSRLILVCEVGGDMMARGSSQ